jgi:hypothetical protein
MKKILFLTIFIATAFLCSTTASAQQRETVVTGKVSYMAPSSVKVLDEYMSSQLYAGGAVFTGWNINLGAFYRKHDNLSWDAYYTNFNGSDSDKLVNPANTQRLKWNYYNFGYGTYYHWNFGEKLLVKAGGLCDFYGAFKEAGPDAVNNPVNAITISVVKVGHISGIIIEVTSFALETPSS